MAANAVAQSVNRQDDCDPKDSIHNHSRGDYQNRQWRSAAKSTNQTKENVLVLA